MDTIKYQKGFELLNSLHGGHSGEAILKTFSSVCPKMAEMTIETIFGDLMQREVLDLKTRELTIIAALVAMGNANPQVVAHTEAALNIGVTKEEIAEVVLQTAYFAGFPAAANAMIAIKDVF